MNKILITLIAILFCIDKVHAQKEHYIEFKKDTEYTEQKIKFFKGEIVQFTNKQGNKIELIANKSKIADLTVDGDTFSENNHPNTRYISDFASLAVLDEDKENIIIDAHSISPKDTVTLISESGQPILRQEGGERDTVGKAELGEYFRLIIKGSPSIYYRTSQLSSNEPVHKTFSSWIKNLLTGMIIDLIFLTGIYMLWNFLQNRKLKPNEVRFRAFSLNDFAANYGGLEKIIELNPRLIPKDYSNLELEEKRKILQKLQGKKLIVEPDNAQMPSFGFHDNSNNKGEANNIFKHSGSSDTILTFDRDEHPQNISQQLSKLENTILNAIRGIKHGDNSGDLVRLNTEINDLKKDKDGLVETVRELKIDKENLLRNIDLTKSESQQEFSSLIKLKEKTIEVDYLRSYCADVLSYLLLCDKVSTDAYRYFNLIKQQNSQQAVIPGDLLLKFQNNIRSIPIGNWNQIVQDIADTGVVSNLQIRNIFKQHEKNEEKNKEGFRWFLFEKVLVKYSSSVLILAEEFRNLRYFQVSSDLLGEIQSSFSAHVSDLRNKVQLAGLENKYVPLFKDYEEYIGSVELANAEKSVPYKVISGLNKDAIVEIVSYGVKTESENTKTLIILA